MSIAEKLTDVAENVPKIYEAGKKAEYDAFWDALQNYGKRTAYNYAFWNWGGAAFKPKYDIKPIGSTSSLFRSVIGIPNLKELLEECGVILDLSQVTYFTDSFYGSEFEYIGELNLTKCSQLNFCFSLAKKLKTIEKLILPTSGTTTFNSAFYLTEALENIVVEGVIGKNIDFSYCTKLTHDSLMSIINALKSGVSGATCTLGTTNLEKLTDAQKAIATEKGWTLA